MPSQRFKEKRELTRVELSQHFSKEVRSFVSSCW